MAFADGMIKCLGFASKYLGKSFTTPPKQKNVDRALDLESVLSTCTYRIAFGFLLFYFLERNKTHSHLDQFQVYMGFRILGFGCKLIFFIVVIFFTELSGSSSL